jgi:hypothetical protein
MAYLLDANVFIEAKNRYYGFDLCPGFWTWIDAANAAGIVISIERVRAELIGGGDDLDVWASARAGEFFLAPDAAMIPSLGVVSAWANAAGYEGAAVTSFLTGADFYLVAHALAHQHTVVTHEIASPGKKIKIPNACLALGVRCVTAFEMLKAERARFVLA